ISSNEGCPSAREVPRWVLFPGFGATPRTTWRGSWYAGPMTLTASLTRLGLTLASSLALPAMASAASTTCLRDSECGGAQACVDATCGTPELPLDGCASEDDCGRGELCIDDHCKSDDIVCRNPAGACWVEGNSGQCSCLDGNGSGWSG